MDLKNFNVKDVEISYNEEKDRLEICMPSDSDLAKYLRDDLEFPEKIEILVPDSNTDLTKTRSENSFFLEFITTGIGGTNSLLSIPVSIVAPEFRTRR